MELNSREGTITGIVVVHATRWEEGILPNFSLRHGRQGLCLASCPLSFLFRVAMPPMANGLVPKLEDSSTSSNQRFSPTRWGYCSVSESFLFTHPNARSFARADGRNPNQRTLLSKEFPSLYFVWFKRRTAQPLLSQKNLLFLFLCSLGHGVTARNAPTTWRNYLPVLEIEWNGVPARNSKCEHEFPHYLPLVSIRRRNYYRLAC
jgi:hypothetical protein